MDLNRGREGVWGTDNEVRVKGQYVSVGGRTLYFQWECRQNQPDWLKSGSADLSLSRTPLLKPTLMQSLAKSFDYIANKQ